MKPRPYHSPLGRWIPQSRDTEETKRLGWQRGGIFVVNSEDARLNWEEKALITTIATKLYGKRITEGE